MNRYLRGLVAGLALLAQAALGQVTTNPGITGVFNPATYTGTYTGSTITATTALVAPAGSASAAAIQFSTAASAGFGFYFRGNNVLDYTSNGSTVWEIDGSGNNKLGSGGVFQFGSTSVATSSADTGLSRISAGVVGVGTGTAGSVAGTIQATTHTVTNASGNSSFTITNAGGSGANSVSITGVVSSAAAQTGYLCYNTTGSVVTYDSGATCLVSREEYKTNLGPIDNALATVLALRPFWGKYNEGTPMADHHVQPFFGARYTAKVDSRLASYDAKGEPLGVRYENMTAVLAAAIQQQQVEINFIKKRLRK